LSRGVAQLHRAGQWTGGAVELTSARFDLGATLNRLAGCFESIAAGRGLRLDVRIDGGLGSFDGDERWIERAVTNVLSNAVRFTAAGGRIAFAARPGPGVIIEVADTGIGIDSSLLAEVFEPFSAAGGDIALHSSGQFEFGSHGLGLGLALAKAAIEAHGGRLTLDSAAGRGTVVRMMLPGG
jgi:signal transduction histidine kinase